MFLIVSAHEVCVVSDRRVSRPAAASKGVEMLSHYPNMYLNRLVFLQYLVKKFYKVISSLGG